MFKVAKIITGANLATALLVFYGVALVAQIVDGYVVI